MVWLLLVCTYVFQNFILMSKCGLTKKIDFKVFNLYSSERQVIRNNYITGNIGREVNLVICTANCIYYYVLIAMKESLFIFQIAYFLRYRLIFMKYDHVSAHFADTK